MLRRLALLLPFALFVALVVPAHAEAGDRQVAQARLDRLKKELSTSKSRSADLLGALDAVEESYRGLAKTGSPGTATPEPDADLEKWRQKWRKGAEKLYLKALALTKLDRRKEQNLRVDVNVRAAAILGRSGHPKLWKDVKRILETRVFKARYEVSQRFLESAFDALAALGDPDALAWMADAFIHTNSSPRKVVDRLVAAQQAFARFPVEKVPGKLRYVIVKKLVKLYPATESVARQSRNDPGIQSVRRFWDRIRIGAIRATQHFSQTPRNENGEALATMQELSVWFRAHKRVQRAPWTDPAPHE